MRGIVLGPPAEREAVLYSILTEPAGFEWAPGSARALVIGLNPASDEPSARSIWS